MAKPTGLMRRSGTYYYRVRVPKDLVAAFGKTEIRKSLNTKDYGEAKKRRNQVAIEWDARFDEARESLKKGISTSAKPLSSEHAVRLVQDYVERMDLEWQQREARIIIKSSEDKRDMFIELAMAEQSLKDPEDTNGQRDISSTSQELLDRSGCGLNEDSIPYKELWELVRRGLLELYRRSQSRLKDDFSASYFDQLFSPHEQVAATKKELIFGKLCDQYFENYLKEAGAKGIQQQSIDSVKTGLDLVREIVEENAPVASIDYDLCLAFRNTLAHVPARRQQFYGSMPLKKVIAAAKKDGRPMMSYVTQARYLRILTQVLNLAHRKKLILDVPSEGLSPIAKKTPDEEQRDPFTLEQLKSFFHSKYYVGCAKHGDRPYLKADKPSRFWLPIISLLTGMRPKEICHMHVADLKESDDGVLYFHVIADKDDKTEKTSTSRRKIPVHPELVRMGFVDYVESVRKQGHKRFFPELTKNKYNSYSFYILRRFRSTYLPSAIKMGKRQVFYSFRHSFRDALRRIEAPAEILKTLGGWSQGKLVSDAYGAGFEAGHLLKYVEKVEYPGLNFSHLYVKEEGS